MATIQDVYRRQGTATRVLNLEIKKEIVRQNAVDTGRMRNVSKIVKLKWNDQTDAILALILIRLFIINLLRANQHENGKMQAYRETLRRHLPSVKRLLSK
jgi:hypothetical protein